LIFPFAALGVLKAIWLLMLAYFYYPPVNRLFAPLLRHFYSDRALHFPQFYYILPHVYNYGALFGIDLIFGIVFTATAIFMIGANYKNEKGGFKEGLRTAIKSLPALVIIWLLKTILTMAIYKYAGPFVLPLVADYSPGYFLAYFIIQMLTLIAALLLVHSLPAIMMHRRKLFPAIGKGLVIALKNPIMTFMLLFIPWLLLLPINYLTTSKLYIIMWKFNAAVLIYLLAIQIFLAIIAGYLLYAGITYFYLNETE
jgi:hypothetical protein